MMLDQDLDLALALQTVRTLVLRSGLEYKSSLNNESDHVGGCGHGHSSKRKKINYSGYFRWKNVSVCSYQDVFYLEFHGQNSGVQVNHNQFFTCRLFQLYFPNFSPCSKFMRVRYCDIFKYN